MNAMLFFSIHFLNEYQNALGKDVNNLKFSMSTLQRKSSKARNIIASSIKNQFKPPERCLVHLNGKIMTDNCRISGNLLAVEC